MTMSVLDVGIVLLRGLDGAFADGLDTVLVTVMVEMRDCGF